MDESSNVEKTEALVVTIDLARLWGDFREFRGEMRTRMNGFETSLRAGLEEIRADTNRRVEKLEDEGIVERVVKLESNWRLAIWTAVAMAILTTGLLADVIYHAMTGG